MGMKAYGTRHGIYPWNEPRKKIVADDKQFYGADSMTQIAVCLGCALTECINCMEVKNANRGKRVPSTTRKDHMCRMRDKFIELYSRGNDVKHICKEMNISRGTYYSYLRRFMKGA